MYRPPAATGRSGPGVSSQGYDGAESFFEQCKTVAGELKLPFMPSGAQESAAAKAALDAYMSARNGLVGVNDAFFHQGKVPAEFQQAGMKGGGDMSLTDGKSPMAELGKAVTEMISNMGDMLNQMLQGPMGMLGQVLSFLFKLFTDVATNIAEALSEVAQAAAAAIEETWKKLAESSTSASTGLQPLELYNQAATTQTLSHALKSASGT